MTVAVQNKDNKNQELSVIEQVVLQGDLSKLDPEQRVLYYKKVCESAGLNPYTRPFDYILLNGKLTLYAKKDATEQLRKLNGISIDKLEANVVDDLYIVKATATTKDGRADQSTGAVVIGHLKGEAKANAIMKAETKAKRRVTLSISGMGWTDESEIESIPNAKMVEVELDTGEIVKELPAERLKTLPEAIITPEQANELALLIDNCTDKTRENIMNYINSELKVSIGGLPIKQFERLKIRAIKDQKPRIIDELEVAMNA